MNASLAQFLQPASKPIARIFGLSFDVTLVLVLIHGCVLLFVAFTTSMSSGSAAPLGQGLLASWLFNTETFRFSEPLNLFVYPFRHDIRSEHFFFLIEMILLFICGRQLENLIGRKIYVVYHVFLIILPPLVLLGLSNVFAQSFSLSSSFYYTIAVCLSTLIVAPKLRIVEGKRLLVMTWLVVVFCAIFFLAQADWQRLAYLSVTLLSSLLFLEAAGFGLSAGLLYPFKNYAQLESQPLELKLDVDTVLEKISRSGLDSLTDQERDLLAKASGKKPSC